MIFAAAAVITSILSGVNKDFSSFEISIRTLYSSALGIFNMEVFTGE